MKLGFKAEVDAGLAKPLTTHDSTDGDTLGTVTITAPTTDSELSPSPGSLELSFKETEDRIIEDEVLDELPKSERDNDEVPLT